MNNSIIIWNKVVGNRMNWIIPMKTCYNPYLDEVQQVTTIKFLFKSIPTLCSTNIVKLILVLVFLKKVSHDLSLYAKFQFHRVICNREKSGLNYAMYFLCHNDIHTRKILQANSTIEKYSSFRKITNGKQSLITNF